MLLRLVLVATLFLVAYGCNVTIVKDLPEGEVGTRDFEVLEDCSTYCWLVEPQEAGAVRFAFNFYNPDACDSWNFYEGPSADGEPFRTIGGDSSAPPPFIVNENATFITYSTCCGNRGIINSGQWTTTFQGREREDSRSAISRWFIDWWENDREIVWAVVAGVGWLIIFTIILILICCLCPCEEKSDWFEMGATKKAKTPKDREQEKFQTASRELLDKCISDSYSPSSSKRDTTVVDSDQDAKEVELESVPSGNSTKGGQKLSQLFEPLTDYGLEGPPKKERDSTDDIEEEPIEDLAPRTPAETPVGSLRRPIQDSEEEEGEERDESGEEVVARSRHASRSSLEYIEEMLKDLN